MLTREKPNTRVCVKCKEEKPLSCFSPRKYTCKPCRCEENKEYYQNNNDRVAIYWAKYYDEHKEEKSIYNKQYRDDHKEKIAQYNFDHKQEKSDYNRWYSKNIRTYHSLSKEEKIAKRFRTRLYQALKGNFKAGSAVRDLGCTIPELRDHLESRFQPGMTWENWGFGDDKWHIDHIIPLDSFDLSDRQHVILACYYLNLTPLWQKDNFSKNARY